MQNRNLKILCDLISQIGTQRKSSLSIQIYREGDSIKIRFDQIVFGIGPTKLDTAASLRSMSTYFFERNKEIYEYISVNFPHINSEIPETKLNAHQPISCFFESIQDGIRTFFSLNSLIYQLPQSLPHAIDCLIGIGDCLNQFQRRHILLLDVQFRASSIDKHISRVNGEWRFSESLIHYLKQSAVYTNEIPFSQLFLMEVLKINNINEQPIGEAIHKLKEYAAAFCDHKFVRELDAETKAGILFDSYVQGLVNPDIATPKKVNMLFALIRPLINEGNKFVLSATISSLKWIARKKLFEPCLGQQAHDGKQYNWRYTEWNFLRRAEFDIRPDGRMSIINIKNNPEYIRFYGGVADLLEKEMRHLGEIIGFSFAKDSVFNSEIIFDHSCTEVLKKKGLHFNERYIKKLLQVKNDWSLFRKFFTYEQSQNESTHFFSFPFEVIDLIHRECIPCLDHNERNSAISIGLETSTTTEIHWTKGLYKKQALTLFSAKNKVKLSDENKAKIALKKHCRMM